MAVDDILGMAKIKFQEHPSGIVLGTLDGDPVFGCRCR
jgi:hypothetical protein